MGINKIEIVVDYDENNKPVYVDIYYEVDNFEIKKMNYAGIVIEEDFNAFQKSFQSFLKEIRGDK